MVRREYLYVFAAAVCLLLASCESARKESLPSKEEEKDEIISVPVQPDSQWAVCASVDDLHGTWECEDGSGFKYPLSADGKVYLLYHEAWKDVSDEWKSLAASQNISLDELWLKRYTLYGWKNPYTKELMSLPVADENGIQKGIKFYRMAGRVFVREEYLITEFVFGRNLRYFLMSQDGKSFKTEGVMHLFSSVFPDFTGNGCVYEETGDDEL